jgi:hypothetical protein
MIWLAVAFYAFVSYLGESAAAEAGCFHCEQSAKDASLGVSLWASIAMLFGIAALAFWASTKLSFFRFALQK